MNERTLIHMLMSEQKDMLVGNINRIFISDNKEERARCKDYALKNINKICELREKMESIL